MGREAVALMDVFLLLFIVALCSIGQRTPWSGEPLSAESTGVITNAVDPSASQVHVTGQGYVVNSQACGSVQEVLHALSSGGSDYVVLSGDEGAGYHSYEALERQLKAQGIRYVRFSKKKGG